MLKAMVEALLPCFPLEQRRYHEGHHADGDVKAGLVIRPVGEGPYHHEMGILHPPKRMPKALWLRYAETRFRQ